MRVAGRVQAALLERLRMEAPAEWAGVLGDDARLEALHPSRSQRTAGAWAWRVIQDGATDYGSQWSMGFLLRCPRWQFGRDRWSCTVDPVAPLPPA